MAEKTIDEVVDETVDKAGIITDEELASLQGESDSENEEKDETLDSQNEENEEDEESETEEDEELSADDLKIAASLMKALRDPSKAKITIANLATNFGVKLTTEEKKDLKEAIQDQDEKSLEELFEDLFPGNWAPMKPIIVKAFEKYEQSRLKPKESKNQQAIIEERSEAAWNHLFEQHEDARGLIDQMQVIAQEMPPGNLRNQADFNKYITRIYTLAKGGESGNKVNEKLAKIVGKTVNNAKRAKPGPSDVTRSKHDVKPKTIDEAVSLAMKGIQL